MLCIRIDYIIKKEFKISIPLEEHCIYLPTPVEISLGLVTSSGQCDGNGSDISAF